MTMTNCLLHKAITITSSFQKEQHVTEGGGGVQTGCVEDVDLSSSLDEIS